MSSVCRTILSNSRSIFSKERPSYDLSLYLVANRPSFSDENLFLSKIAHSVKGGVTCVQLRDHTRDFSSIVRTAERLKKILNGVPLFINTLKSMEVAKAVNAEGIYLEEKECYSEVRRFMGKKIIIGVPTKTIEDVCKLEQDHDIDYLSVKVFPSKRTCSQNDILWGLEGLRKVRSLTGHRIVAIGGLNLACAESIYSELCNNDGVAMAGGLMDEENPYIVAQKIQFIHQKIRGQS